MQSILKYLLLPLSWLYGSIVWLRNKLYDRGVFESYHSRLKTIVIGNLQVGGSGKTPMTAYLYELLSPSYKTAILSRGYGRKMQGLIEAVAASSPESIGDEPFWYFNSLRARVVLAEKRKEGLLYLEKSDTELVLLDDAFQHRAVLCDIQLLLTEFSKPYYTDYMMPAGRMREFRNGDKRADAIVVTKCPDHLTLEAKVEIIKRINPLDYQEVFFTGLKPLSPLPLKGEAKFNASSCARLFALSGIASPDSFTALCKGLVSSIKSVQYSDHYTYTETDVLHLVSQLRDGDFVMCTEKDAVKLKQAHLLKWIPENRFYMLPVRPYFLFGDAPRFSAMVKSMLVKNSPQHLSATE